ncbi:MAG: hypothetical protein M3132_08270 [Actinomycetia bacterium]|nr:hypothetical protein [Actinomycetes bacterium]
MAEGTQIDRESEDGSWFLEAVGVKKVAPSPIESIAELERENTLVDLPVVELSRGDSDEESGDMPKPPRPVAATTDANVIEMTSFDGDPGTSLSSFDPVPDLPPMPSNVVAAVAVETIDEPDILSETVDESDLSAPLKTRRPFRWPAFGLGVAVIAAVVLGIVWLPKAADSAAAATRTSYYDASLTVREFLPTAQASLDIVTNPSSTDAALGTVIPVVSELTSDATNLATVAAEPLPTVLPFLSSDAVDELPPLQDRSAILASDASEVARQIGHAYIYRTSIADLLVVGDLPIVAETEEINALSVTLASSLAENASLIADLPANDAFDDIAANAAEAVGAYAQWQEDYLEALADGDAAAAQELIDTFAEVRATLLVETAQSLASFREVLDDRIVSLSGEFDDHLANLSQ